MTEAGSVQPNQAQPDQIRHCRIGQASVYSLNDAHFRLDGGSMFGVVPKNLWSKITVPDEHNRISLCIRPLLIQLQNKNILIETGFDDQSGEKFESIYGVQRNQSIFDQLEQLKLSANDIDIVINTHLHFDHAGRNTRLINQQAQPSFPNARYLVQRQELEDARNPHERNRASYLPHHFMPVLEAGLFDLLDGECEILPGLRVQPVPGHNLGQQAVILESEGQGLVYTADLLPTFAHVPYAFIMGFDLYPMTSLEQRKRFFPVWCERDYLICTPHDPNHAWGKFRAQTKGGFVLEPV